MVVENDPQKQEAATGSLIKQIATLQARIQEQESTKQNTTTENKDEDENEKLRNTVKYLNEQLKKYDSTISEYKKNDTEKMQTTYDTTIAPWFEGCIRDNTDIAEQFVSSIQDAIKDARTKDGVWQIAMAASVKHKELIEKVNSLNSKIKSDDGKFDDINNRKRTDAEDDDNSNDVFSSFKRRCM